MKNLTYLLITALLVSCASAQNPAATRPEWKATVKATEEDGQPIEGADVTIGYYIPAPEGQSIAMAKKSGRTDTNGIFMASERSTSVDLEFNVRKAGYYSTFKSYELGAPYQYDPVKWSPNLTLVLKKIDQPIPMYAKKEETKMPKESEPVGFDLMAGDWVAPFGAGKSADLFFTVHRKIVGAREYDAELKLTFPNPSDGVVVVPPAPDTGSALVMPRPAPENGYQLERLWHYSNASPQPEPVLGYFLRVRTVLDEEGGVKSALYGKMLGDIRFYVGTKAPRAGMGFTYYLNPEVNSRNVEFDPKQNLLKGLKSTEQVDAP